MLSKTLRSSLGRTLAGIAILFVGTAAGLPAQALPPPAASNAPQPLLSPDQLDDLVAPIALYPDPLVSQVLVACTYPLEVVEAGQWLQQNNSLSGQPLMDAARQQGWDASVTALVALPDVLNRLNSDTRWTVALGDAFLAQQADVMSAIQRMRQRAQANGRLQTTAQQRVIDTSQGGQPIVEIEPVSPEVIYVPAYDPYYVWGPPIWGAYPYLYYPTFGFGFGPGIDIGLCFGGWGGWGGWGFWGWHPNWYGRSVFVNNAFFGHYGFRGGFGGGFSRFGGTSVWAHDPGHRLGVSYPNRALTGRFGAASMASRANIGRFAARNSFGGGGSFGANRGAANIGRANASQFGGGARSFAGGGARSFSGGARSNAAPNWNGARNFSGGARSNAAPSYGGGARNFGGGARSYAAPSYGGGARSFGGGGGSAPRGFSGGGGGARSFGGGGGGGARSFGGGGGGGGARSFGGGGGGGARSFGGGGGGGGARSFGGGGGGGHSSGGGGGHGGRR